MTVWLFVEIYRCRRSIYQARQCLIYFFVCLSGGEIEEKEERRSDGRGGDDARGIRRLYRAAGKGPGSTFAYTSGFVFILLFFVRISLFDLLDLFLLFYSEI